MSNSGESDSNTSSSENQVQGQVKKYRLKRTGNLLTIPETEEELNYRKNFKILNIVMDTPKLVSCTKCNASFVNDIVEGKKIYSHPLLKVLMCEPCTKFYGDGEFSLDEDDEDKYCRWCGEGGKLFLCSKCICGFCPKCIKKNFGVKKAIEIKGDDDWICYFCDPKPLWKLRNICELAQEQSAANKVEKCRNSSGALKKTVTGSKILNQTKETTNCGKNENDTPESHLTNSVGSRRRLRYTRSSRQFKHVKSKGDTSSSSVNSFCDNDEPKTKKRKITGAKGETRCLNGSGKKKRELTENGRSSSSDAFSSSDSDDEMTEEETNTLNEEKRRNFKKNKNAEKFKEILKVGEITSELCFQFCKKRKRKLEKKNCSIPNGKLISYCENLKSVVILMSSSLSTVYNMIISLERKFGAKGWDSMFRGGDDTSLLKTMTHFLKKKRVKTSHQVTVVNDILNRYPYFELGCSRIGYSVCNSETNSIDYNNDGSNDKSQNAHVNSDAIFGDIRTKESVVSNLEGFGEYDSVSPKKISQDEVTPHGKEYCDSDTSTDIFEPCNRSDEGIDDQALNSVFKCRDTVMNDEQSRKSSLDFGLNMKQMYENSLKLKEEILKDSSDEISFSDSETNDSLTGDCYKRKPAKGKGLEKKTKPNRLSLSKEEREIRKLTNLNSLERRAGPEDSDPVASSESAGATERQINKRNRKEEEKESDSNILLRSDSDNPPSEEEQLQSGPEKTDFINQCSSFLKEYILKSTSSESEVDEDDRKVRKKSTVKESRVSSSDEGKGELMKEPRSPRENLESKSNSESREESDDMFEVWKRKKRRTRIVISSDSSSSELTMVKSPKGDSPVKGRKTIRKILETGRLELTTRQAIKVENERRKKIAERNELYEKFFPRMEESERLVLDFDLKTGEVLLEAPKAIVKILKPHQKEGVKFMWDSCFQSLAHLEKDHGSGCILAHCMGLGKSLQIITLITTVMNNDLGVNTVLILCPLNVVNNWVHEFNFWLKDDDLAVDVYTVANKCKKGRDRYLRIKTWHTKGGVLILSYDMMRNLTKSRGKVKGHVEPGAEPSKFLLDPGPDLVVCDEGHIIKNEDTSLSKCVREIKTARRIVLTGTPLQNNLLEYHSMVQFIKPNILGTKKEFMNRFGNPIRNGQFEDSTALDVKLMRARAHVLHKLLGGCIQRFDYSVLRPFLPEKQEYVISIRLTETQGKLYQYYLEKCKKTTVSDKRNKLFSDFSWLQKIWTHPKLVLSYLEERGEKNDESEQLSDDSVVCIEPDASDEAYWKEVIKPEECEAIHSSGKLLILFDILAHCRKLGDKILLFSHSLKNLNLIEHFLHKFHLAKISNEEDKDVEGIPPEYFDTWVEGLDYFRMDGSTGNDERSKFCKWFNSKNQTRARLFLISTKAGGLGINLVGANRVVLFDASWNPSHDVQSIFRVYRFGQTKTCYIYRLVAEATMEEKIYERQVTKLSLEKRVLDEHQIKRRYSMGNLQALYKYDPLRRDQWKVPMIPKDMLLADILKVRKDVIVNYHEHDSLLENKEDEGMSEEERKAAWEDFEKERFTIENNLKKSREPYAVSRSEPTIEELTREVLRITGINRPSGSNASYCMPPPKLNPMGNAPLKTVVIHSKNRMLAPGSTNQNYNFHNFPKSFPSYRFPPVNR